MKRLTLVAALVAALGTLGSASRADAQYGRDNTMRPRLILKGMFGFTGDIDVGNGIDFEGPGLRTSLGVAAEGEAPIASFFSFGGMVGALWYDPQNVNGANIGRSTLVDINVVPKLRLPWDTGETHGQVYIGVPGGLTLSFLDTDLANFVGEDVRTGFGWNIGGVIGAQIFLNPAFGIVGEVGYHYHWFRHTFDETLTGNDRANFSFSQFMVNAGIVLAF